MTVRLTAPSAFSHFKDAITGRPGPALQIERENDYYAEQAKSFDQMLKTIAYVVGGIMGLGATFGALNTMYSAIASRGREIATLRAIGFSGSAVVISVMSEAVLFCVAGAGLGVLFAWALFNGYQHAMGGAGDPAGGDPGTGRNRHRLCFGSRRHRRIFPRDARGTHAHRGCAQGGVKAEFLKRSLAICPADPSGSWCRARGCRHRHSRPGNRHAR